MRAGFTLVEVSIVLVIVGLLVGGVLTGRSLIRAAELRSVATEFSRYVSSIHTFRDKYFALPGDMANATTYWGSLGGTGSDATCQAISATGAPTCNGNGDGVVDTSVTSRDETRRFWQHLVNAGLIEGRYTGLTGAVARGVNVPAARLDSLTYWNILPGTGYAGSNYWFAFSPGTLLAVMGGGTAIFTPAEEWNIDIKLDDGKPGTGGMIAYKNNTGNCTTATNQVPPADAGATYALSYDTKECLAAYFPNPF